MVCKEAHVMSDERMSRRAARMLQNKIDKILKGAAEEPVGDRLAMGSINWGDLRCVDIEEAQSLLYNAPPVIVATIEEASSSAIGLCLYVRRKLGEEYKDVCIVTDW
jgi:hypothetical protein